MTFTPLLHTLGSAPFFATRPFLSTFVFVLLARFTTWLPFFPEWSTSNSAIGVLGGLALVDIFIAKSDEFRHLLDEFGTPLRALINFVVVFFFLNSQTDSPISLSEFFGSEESGLDLLQTLQLSASALAIVWGLFSAASVWLFSTWRASIWRAIRDVDDGDDIGLQGMLSWVEDLWSVIGVVIAILFPLAAILIYVTTLLALFITQKSIVHLQERRKVTCKNCNSTMIATAVACQNCGQPNHAPQNVGMLGQAKPTLVQDLTAHRHRLRTRKRCPVCATRLSDRRVQQSCSGCGTITFAHTQELSEYLDIMAGKLPRTLLICGALSFFPLVGIIPGIIFYHLYLISGLRGYIPRTTGCVTRWGVIILNLILIALQSIPLVGTLMLPLMCLISYRVYRSVLVREGHRVLKDA